MRELRMRYLRIVMSLVGAKDAVRGYVAPDKEMSYLLAVMVVWQEPLTHHWLTKHRLSELNESKVLALIGWLWSQHMFAMGTTKRDIAELIHREGCLKDVKSLGYIQKALSKQIPQAIADKARELPLKCKNQPK